MNTLISLLEDMEMNGIKDIIIPAGKYKELTQNFSKKMKDIEKYQNKKMKDFKDALEKAQKEKKLVVAIKHRNMFLEDLYTYDLKPLQEIISKTLDEYKSEIARLKSRGLFNRIINKD